MEDVLKISNDGNMLTYCGDVYVKQSMPENGKLIMFVDGNKVVDVDILDIISKSIDPISRLDTDYIISLLRKSKCELYDEVHIYDDGSIMLGHGRMSKLTIDDINMIKDFLFEGNEKRNLTNKKISAFPKEKGLPIGINAFHQVVFNICKKQFEVPVEPKKE